MIDVKNCEVIRMSSTRYLIQALVHGEKNDKRNYKKNITTDRLEKGIDTIDTACENVDKVDTDDGPRSICFLILFYWGLFEMVILSLVLLKTGRKNYGQQVIHKLCENDCSNYITNGLIIRLLLALYMTLGAFRNNWILCLPWLLIDSFGFFPLIPIIVSAFFKYTDFWVLEYFF